LAELIAKLTRSRQLIGQALGLAVRGSRCLSKLAGDAVEGAGELAGIIALGRAALALAHRVSAGSHPLRDPLTLQVARHLTGSLAGIRLALFTLARRLLAQFTCRLLQTLRAIGKPLLFARQTASRLVASARSGQLLRLAGQPAFGVGQLARLELEVAH